MKWAAALLVVLALAAGGFLVYRDREQREAERLRAEALARTVTELRAAIAKHHADTGRYPATLQELVPQYLPKVPADPITGSANWRFTTEETVTPSEDFTAAAAPRPQPVITDVHSAAPGADANGRAWSDY
jgi:general secretion pathway protein G